MKNSLCDEKTEGKSNPTLTTVDWEIVVVKKFSPLGHPAKIKHANISYATICSIDLQ